MKPARLRRWMQKYGNLGVLMVGAYLALHHVRHRRRVAFLIVAGGLCLLPAWLLLHPRTHRRPMSVVSALPTPAPPLPPPPPPVALAAPEGPLQDDTEPGLPLPDADTVAAIRNGDVYFSARYYRWSGEFYQSKYGGEKKETLAEQGPSHLYRMCPDGSHRVPLTWGQYDDTSPRVSPDGQHLAFVRSLDWQHGAVYLMSARGGPATRLQGLPAGELLWSPDGKYLAVLAYENKAYLYHVASHTVQPIPEVTDFAWSPDGRYYARYASNRASIVNLKTHASLSVQDGIRNPLWLDTHTLCGDPDHTDSSNDMCGTTLHFINDQGIKQRQVELEVVGPFCGEGLGEGHTWYRLPHHRTTLILQTRHQVSDGGHYGCFRVDMLTGKCRAIGNGVLIALSPDGKQAAIADHNWVGPYKRGGARVGPMQIVALKTGRVRDVTDPLGCLCCGGDWRPGVVSPRLTKDQALLSAIEEGDTEQVRTLLERGASANAHYAEGTTALMLAAADGRADMVSLLLSHQADVHATDKKGNTPLFWAIGATKAADDVSSTRTQETVQRLLMAGARVNLRNSEGHTPLMVAARLGRATLVPLLLNHHADVNAQSEDGWTALMFAASENNPNTVRVLLKTANSALCNKDGETAHKLIGESYDESHAMTQKHQATEAAFERAGVKE